MSPVTTRILPTISVLFSGAIFGFFYAWTCSTVWGLDTIDPSIAISAMQAMNASVQNALFGPIFFGTPIVLLITSIALLISNHKSSGLLLLAAAIIYLAGSFFITVRFNVPLNEELATYTDPNTLENAKVVWQNYSKDWQFWNQVRTFFCGLSLLIVTMGIMNIKSAKQHDSR